MLRPSQKNPLPIPEFLQILGSGVIILLFYSLARLVFFAVNAQYLHESAANLIQSMLTGLRFDLATLAYGSALGFPLLALGAGLSKFKPLRTTALWLLYLPHAASLFLNLADIAYFRHTFRRQTNELFTMTSEALTATKSEASHYWWLILLSVVFLIALYFTLSKFLCSVSSRTKRNRATADWRRWVLRALLTAALFGLGALLARGGLQNRPLRTGMAYTTDNPALGQLALNSAYSVIWSRLHQQGQTIHYLDNDSARVITQKLLRNPSDTFISKDFPFLRISEATHQAAETQPWNIVIFIMESWNARQTGAITHNQPYPGVTPFFDSLARDGLLFSNCFASGDRSIHAFPAVVASLPNLTGNGILHTSLETMRVRGLGSILKEQGYTTVFAMGAEPSSMGFDSYALACGFDLHWSEDSYPALNADTDENQWGIFDEKFLAFIDKRLSEVEGPFALTFFSLTAHAPYVVPDAFARQFPITDDTNTDDINIDDTASESVEAQRQRRALRYADYSLSKFFASARTRDYFNHTIFFITGDHTGWEEHTGDYNGIQRFQVPLLIYAPALIQPGVDSLPANQVDILPTALSLLRGQNTGAILSASLGQSLVETHDHRISFSAKAAVFNFLYDSLVLQATADTVLGAYNYIADPLLHTNFLKNSENAENSEALSEAISEALKAYHAYLQTGTNALVEDRIFPAGPVLQGILNDTGDVP